MATDPETGLPVDENGNILNGETLEQGASMIRDFTPDLLKAFDDDEFPAPASANGAVNMENQDVTGGDIEFAPGEIPGTDRSKAPPTVDLGADSYNATTQQFTGTPGQQAPQAPLAPGQSVGTTRSFGVGQGESHIVSAYTDPSKKYAAGVFGTAEAKADKQLGNYRSDINAQQQKILEANVREQAALKQQAAAIEEHQNNMMELYKKRVEANQKFNDLQVQAMNMAKKEAAQYMANYQRDIGGMRSLIMQSGNPYVGMNPIAGTAVALGNAVQGFLGARYGINVNVAGQVDRIVDRELQAHQQQVENMGVMANQQLTLGNWARQNAQDETEARLRANGFVLEALKAGMYMEGARYQSKAAQADAAVKGAELDKLAAKNAIDLRDKIEGRINDAYKAQADIAKQQSDAASKSIEVASQSRLNAALGYKAYAEGDKAKAEANPAQPDMRIMDPITGEYVAAYDTTVDKGIREKAASEIPKAQADFKVVDAGLKDLIRLKKIAEKHGWTGVEMIDKVKSPFARNYLAALNHTISAYTRSVSGAQFTDKEFERYASELSPDKFLQSGSNDQLITLFGNEARRAYKAKLNSYKGAGIRDLQDNEHGVGKFIDAAPGDEAVGNAEIFALEQADTPAGKLAETVGSARYDEVPKERKVPGAGKSGGQKTVAGGGYSPAFKQFTDANPKLNLVGAVGITNGRRDDAGQTVAIDAIDEMARGFINPKEVTQDTSDGRAVMDSAQMRAELISGLEQVATGKTYSGQSVPTGVAKYAETVSKRLRETPADQLPTLYSDFGGRISSGEDGNEDPLVKKWGPDAQRRKNTLEAVFGKETAAQFDLGGDDSEGQGSDVQDDTVDE